jgi:hypothetical protein
MSLVDILMIVTYLVVVLIITPLLVAADSCTDYCDITFADGIQVKFCGTDYLTYQTHYSAISSKCYFKCGVMAQYAGTCDCPNNCFEELGHGTCTSNGNALKYVIN